MAEPAITSALDAVLDKITAIVPTIDPSLTFRRTNERVPATTRGGKRLFDVEFEGHPRDLSNDGAGFQNPGLAHRIASFVIAVEYPVGTSEKALETTIAVDSELLLRTLHRSANWNGTPVRRCSARTSVDRSAIDATEVEPGVLRLLVALDVTYLDTE